MRCKKHPSDLSSSGGVCASCLRERLFALIAAQSQSHSQAQLRAALDDRRATLDDRRATKPDSHPPPLVFPRSVSPYVSRRKSDDATWHPQNHLDHRFYSTPQVGPTHAPTGASSKKKRFSLISTLFRSRSDKASSDGRPSARNSTDSSSSSPSWFSAILPARRKKQLRLYSLDYSISNVPTHGRTLDRGMSPAGTVDDGDDVDDRSPSSSESSPQRWRRTPVAGPAASTARKGRHGQGQGRNLSGLAFCLSPLVRASPSRQWKQNGGGLPSELAYSGEVRVSAKPHLSTAASFCANRSRKLADFGRLNHNR